MKFQSALLPFLCLTAINACAAAPAAIKPVGKEGQPLNLDFEDFKFYAQRPKFDNELEPAKTAAESPPADIVPYAGLSPQDACDKASLPPGFKMQLFAGEPDVKQPIAFCLDDRGRVWVAEGYTYPRRHGKPPPDDRTSV